MNQNERIQIEISLDERSLKDVLTQVRNRIEREDFNLTIAINDQSVLTALNRIIEKLGDVATEVGSAIGALNSINDSIDLRRATDNIGGLEIALALLAGPIGNVIEKTKLFEGATFVLKGPIGLAALALGGLWYALGRGERVVDRLIGQLPEYTDLLSFLQQSYVDLEERATNYGEATEWLNQLYQDGHMDAQALAEGLWVLESGYERLRNQQDEVRYGMQTLSAYMQIHGLSYDMLNETQQAFVDRGATYWQRYADMSSEAFRLIGEGSQVGLEEALAFQEANYEATKAWHNNLQVLYQRYGEAVFQEFYNMGESGMLLTSEMAANVLENYNLMADGTYECLGRMEGGSASFATQFVDNIDRGGDLASAIMIDRLGEGSEMVVGLMAELSREAPQTLREGFVCMCFFHCRHH